MNRRLTCAIACSTMLSIGAASCGSDAKKSASTTTAAGASTVATTGGDGCHVDVTGGTTLSWDSPDGPYAVDYGPWTPGGLDKTFFNLNCTESGAQNVIGFSANGVGVDVAPQTFQLHASSPANTDPLVPTIFMNGSTWVLAGDSTLTITEFDGEHIAGSFALAVTDAINDGTAQISGTFSLTNKHGN